MHSMLKWTGFYVSSQGTSGPVFPGSDTIETSQVSADPTVSTEQEGEKERGTGEVCCEGGKGSIWEVEKGCLSPLCGQHFLA